LQQTAEARLATGNVDDLISELLDCIPAPERRHRDKREAIEAIDALVRYYRTNAHRMKYDLFREHGCPIGSGAVEKAPIVTCFRHE
jgi:hypothetical protein